jgi:tether containing UBX domain for GLUT4
MICFICLTISVDNSQSLRLTQTLNNNNFCFSFYYRVGNSENLLETKQQRERREQNKHNKYESTVIRICFPYDKLVLQAVFKPEDTINDAIKVINSHLKDNVKDFYLYSSPPKNILKLDSTLMDLNLVPAALIHFGVKSMSTESVLKPELKEKITSYKLAAKIALESRRITRNLTPNESSVHSIPKQSVNLSENIEKESYSSSDSRPTDNSNKEKETKIPKWFKKNK